MKLASYLSALKIFDTPLPQKLSFKCETWKQLKLPNTPKTSGTRELNSSHKNSEILLTPDPKNQEESPNKTKRFTVPSIKKFQNARSLSPITKKNFIQDEIEDSKVVKKYKMMRIEGQERDIKLNHMLDELQEEIPKKNLESNLKIANLVLKIAELTIEGLNKSIPLFKEVPKILESYLFCVNEELMKKIRIFFNMNTNSIRQQLYIHLIEKLCKKMEIFQRKQQEESEKIRLEVQNLETNLSDKIFELLIANEKLKNNEQEYKEKFDKEVSKYQEKTLYMEKEKNKYFNAISKLQEELFKTQETIKKEREDFIEKSEIKITDLETHEESLSQALMLKEKEVFELKLNYNTLYENYKKSLISMKTFKEKLCKNAFELNELINENHKLKVRAATAWEELTPRPSFRQFVPILDLDDDFFQKKSTETLTKEIANLCTEKFFKSPKIKKNTRKITFDKNDGLFSPLNSNLTKQKKDFSRGILQKLETKVLHKRGSFSCEMLD